MPTNLSIDALPESTPFEVTIDDYGYTGEGFVRLEDGWLSVRGAMPGERVRVELEPGQPARTRRKFARVVQLLRPHPERRDALCDWDAHCRGCQLRHVSISEEVAYKARTIREVVTKFAGVAPEDQPEIELISPAPIMRADAWRIRSDVTYKRTSTSSFELGLVVPGADQLIPMSSCPALSVPPRRLLAQVEAAIERAGARDVLPHDASSPQAAQIALWSLRVAAPAHGRGFVELRTGARGEQAPGIQAILEEFDDSLPANIGVFVDRGGKFDDENDAYLHWRGPDRMRIMLGGMTLQVDPRDWFHAALEPADMLYEEVERLLDIGEDERFLDVGCGVGTLSLMAAKRGARSLGIDYNRASISTARLNAEEMGLEHAEFMAGSWEAALKKLLMRGERFDVATINPMREPLGQRAIACINNLGVERLAYLGPSPASAARDLGELRERGWRLDYLGAAMLHLATYHVMLVAVCSRR